MERGMGKARARNAWRYGRYDVCGKISTGKGRGMGAGEWVKRTFPCPCSLGRPGSSCKTIPLWSVERDPGRHESKEFLRLRTRYGLDHRFGDDAFPEGLSRGKLIAGEVELTAVGKPVPGMPLDRVGMGQHLGEDDLTPEVMADDEGTGPALSRGWTVRRPRRRCMGGLGAPGGADRCGDLCESWRFVHVGVGVKNGKKSEPWRMASRFLKDGGSIGTEIDRTFLPCVRADVSAVKVSPNDAECGPRGMVEQSIPLSQFPCP